MNSYRKSYIKEHGEFPSHWHIHHIDGDNENGEINNLIAIPEIVHVMIHQRGNKNKPLPNRLLIEQIIKKLESKDQRRNLKKERRWVNEWISLLGKAGIRIDHKNIIHKKWAREKMRKIKEKIRDKRSN